MLRLVGADLRPVPAVPYKDPNNYVKTLRPAGRGAGTDRAQRRDLGQPVRQHRQPDWATTAPPDRRSGRRPAGKVDAFICAVGTGGTLAGVGMYLKERKPEVRIGLADPMGAALYN